MSNFLVRVSFTVDVSEERAEKLVGRPDDDSQQWYEDGCDAAAEWVRENLPVAMDFVTNEPDVECD